MKLVFALLMCTVFSSFSFSQGESTPAEAMRILSESLDFKLSFYRVYSTPPDNDSSVFGVTLTLQGQYRYVGGVLNVWVIGQPHHFSLLLKDCVAVDAKRIMCKSSESEIPIYLSIQAEGRTLIAGLEPSMLLVLKAAKSCDAKAVNCAEEYVMTKDDIARFSNLMNVKNSQLSKLIEKEFIPLMKK